MIVADLWDRNIDVCAPEVRHGRTWLWLKLQIEGLLSVPPQLVPLPTARGYRVVRVPQTRLGLALDPPDLSPPAHVTAHTEED